MPRVSIILNIRNGEPYLREAIDSALAQTFTDWEMIAFDDCSTDNSADVVRSYRDPRIAYYLSPNDTPLGEARNNAIALARGEWLAFLDQDDVWLPGKLEQQLALAGDRVGIIYGRTIAFDPAGREWDFDHKHEFQALPEGDIFEALFRDSCFIAMSSAMLRADALGSEGPIPSEFSIIPDYYMYVSVARHLEARAVQHPVCRYRFHGANMTSRTWRLAHQEALRLIAAVGNELPPRLAEHRNQVHWTILALDSLRAGHPLDSLSTLLTRGSLPYLLSRPGAIIWRHLRRRFSRPLWQAQS